MTRPRPRIGSELLPLFLILLSLAGTLALVLAVHRRGAAARRQPNAPQVAAVPAPAPRLETPPEPEDEPEPPAPPPAEDPTKKALAQLASAIEVERELAGKADRRAESLEAARRAAVATSEHWRRRESLVRAQIDTLAEQAERTQMELDAIAMERDALLRERDAAKAKLARARSSSSYAILPHKGPNGTWRRPIVIECRNGAASLQPGGAAFGMLELSVLGGLRNSSFVRAVAREVVRISGESAADGGVNVPYVFFVIRPDGIRPYYEARARLEMLGIAFGYELVDQDWEFDFSELEHPAGADPLSPAAPSRTPAVAEREELTWPGERPGGSSRRGDGDPGDTFVWHSRPAGSPTGNPGTRSTGRQQPSTPGSAMPATPGPGRLATTSAAVAAAREGALGSAGTGPLGPPATAPGSAEVGGLAAGSAPGATGGDAGIPFSMPGGQSATERAFGTPGQLAPVGPAGLPALEPADGSGGSGATGSAGQLVAGNDGLKPFGGSSQGRAGGRRGAPIVGRGSLGTADDDEPPQDGRIPVSPRGYSDDDEDDDDDPAQDAKPGARGGEPGSAGSAGATDALAESNGAAGDLPRSADSAGASPGAPGGSAGSAAGGSGSAQGSRKSATGVDKPPLRIEVPFEMTVVCNRGGVVIHPGGYRLSPQALKSKDQMLVKELNAVLQQRREVDPLIVPRPRLKFLVEPGGGQSYNDARKQTALAGLAWPTTIQVGETSVLSFSGRETTR